MTGKEKPGKDQFPEWTKLEIFILREHHKDTAGNPMELNRLCRILKRTRADVAHKANVLGLHQKNEQKGECRSNVAATAIEQQPPPPAQMQTIRQWKAGRRPDLGNIYFRAKWEANYARYLNMLKKLKAIHKWEYEPDTFWFEKIKRGVRSYKPDFKVWDRQGSDPYYIEIKGYLDQKSRTKLKRMAKYYPHIRVDVVSKKEYAEIRKRWADSTWE
jgi:hypothetical protein